MFKLKHCCFEESAMNHDDLHLPENLILSALPQDVYERLKPYFEKIKVEVGTILAYQGDSIKNLYFPESGMISMIIETPDGEAVEAGAVGREGLTGFSSLFGVDYVPHLNTVQLPGSVIGINADVVKAEFKRGGALHDLVLRYFNAFIMQVSQTALCNRYHLAEQRLARWLLMSHDRAETDDLPITQEFLAVMIGVHRPSVTIAAAMLQNAGFIKYSRGVITMLERKGLEEICCSCYGLVKNEYDQLTAHFKL